METAVVFLVFNRPDCTARVFEQIRQARPAKLLVVADGPRSNRPDDVTNCRTVRDMIANGIDWPCELLSDLSDVNLGCRERVSSGLDWAFGLVEAAIILEDDCVPNPTFFQFCQELLEKYRDDERIMSISGNNFLFDNFAVQHSYYFSRYSHIWGWATWRRAWRCYDHQMAHWPAADRCAALRAIVPENAELKHWTRLFEATHRDVIDTWDYRWLFSCWINSGLTILPSRNLVTNIGFDFDGTHTTARTRYANIPHAEITFPLSHPPTVLRHFDADRFSGRTMRNEGALRRRAIRKLQRVLRRMIGNPVTVK